MHENRIPPCALFFGETRAVALQTFGRRESTWRAARRPPKRKNYAAAAFGAAIFFFDFGFFSSNSKPIFPFSSFR